MAELGLGVHKLLDYPAGVTVSLTVSSGYRIIRIQNYSTFENIQAEWTSSETCTFSMPQEGVIINVVRVPPTPTPIT